MMSIRTPQEVKLPLEPKIHGKWYHARFDLINQKVYHQSDGRNLGRVLAFQEDDKAACLTHLVVETSDQKQSEGFLVLCETQEHLQVKWCTTQPVSKGKKLNFRSLLLGKS